MLADEVVALPGSEIRPADVHDADALVVRTRTRCDEQLLAGSSVRFVATATIGFDHLDTDYLQRAAISWTNCPGCNAASVAQYVESSLLLLSRQKGLSLSGATIGIVGCGHVGSKVRAVAQRLGLHVLVCDPPLAHPDFVPLEVIGREADIITFHVPLIQRSASNAQQATYHMADEAFFHSLRRVPYIINTSRGEVVHGQALLAALQEGRVRDAVIDVWENEPHPDSRLLQRVFIGTPHIAGYSADGKVNADNMVIDALCRYFKRPHPGRIEPPQLILDSPYTGDPLQLYNPLTDSLRLKQHPSEFENLRNHYPLRREKV